MSIIGTTTDAPHRSADAGPELNRDIAELTKRARCAGYFEVGHFLAVAAEALKDATARDDEREADIEAVEDDADELRSAG